MVVKARAAIIGSHDSISAALARRIAFSENIGAVSEARTANDLLVHPEVVDAQLALFFLSLSDPASEVVRGIRHLVSGGTTVLVSSLLPPASIKETILGALRAGASDFHPLHPSDRDPDPSLVETVDRLITGQPQASPTVSFLLFAEDKENPRRDLTDHERQALFHHSVGRSHLSMARTMKVDTGYAVECLERAHTKLLRNRTAHSLPSGILDSAASDRTASAPAPNHEAIGRREETRRHRARLWPRPAATGA